MHVLTFLWLAHSACRSLEAVQQTICIPIKIKTDLFVKRLRVGTCVKMQTCMLISFYVLCPTSSASFDFIAVHPFCACVVRLCVCACARENPGLNGVERTAPDGMQNEQGDK